MKKFISYFQTYFEDGFNWQLHLVVLLFLAISIWLNYYYNIERSVIGYRSWRSVGGFFLLQIFPFLFVILMQCFFKSDWSIFGNIDFWFIVLFGFFFLAFSRGFPYTLDLARLAPNEIFPFAARTIMKGKRLLTIIIPLFIFYLVFRSKYGYNSFFGLAFKNVHFQPYIILLLCMIPLVYFASLSKGFLSHYPIYKDSSAHLYLGVPKSVVVGIWEFIYGFSFIAVELFFRGFLVLGLAFLLGKEAILPMAATYVFLHFGKPMGETISSFFGGYILGILALYSGNIWGGVVVHVGIAWLMEFMAWFQISTKD